MTTPRMHADEVDTDADLVRRLLAGQFPQWADLPIRRVRSAGTDNAIYRLGDHLAVRLPRIHWAAGQVEKDWRWLPRLAPHLPLPIHAPVAVGQPAEGFPWTWGVYPWLPGEAATPDRLDDLGRVATDLAAFILALQAIDTTGGPTPPGGTVGRGVPLVTRDAAVRRAIAQCGAEIDAGAVTAAWDASVSTAGWDRPPVWLHGDLSAGNLLAQHGRLSAVIDFGTLVVGDPACDLQPAWTLFSGASRHTFRAALGVDDASWLRGRGWALSVALIALPYYLETNPVIVAASRHAICEVLADHQGAG